MRIIGGTKGRLRIPNSDKLNVRPTKDIAKEALFNILNNKIEYKQSNALDLFSGTGAISYELASRGVEKVTAVEISLSCTKFINKTIKSFDLENTITLIKADALNFIKTSTQNYNLIFADPPYNFNKLSELINNIFSNNLLARQGVFILEHEHNTDLDSMPKFSFKRKYGKTAFSFFENN